MSKITLGQHRSSTLAQRYSLTPDQQMAAQYANIGSSLHSIQSNSKVLRWVYHLPILGWIRADKQNYVVVLRWFNRKALKCYQNKLNGQVFLT